MRAYGVSAAVRIGTGAAPALWTPEHQVVGSDPTAFRVFIKADAVAALRGHVASVQQVEALGFLGGTVFTEPQLGFPYIVIETAIPLPATIDAGHPSPAVLHGLIETHDQLQRTGDQLLGWYRTHRSGDGTLSPEDVGAHLAFFDKPWHVALAIARTEAGNLTGAFYRRSTESGWPHTRVAYCELSEGEQPGAAGSVRTLLALDSERAEVPAPELEVEATSAKADRPAPAAILARLVFPDDLDDQATARHAAAWIKPVARVCGYAIVALLAAVGLMRVYGANPDGPSGNVAPGATRPAVAPLPPNPVGPLADTLELALQGFDVRARLFEGRKMTCTDLARGLMTMEERWTGYALATAGGRTLGDSAQAVRDQLLASDVDAAERRFARTACQRP